MTTVVVWTDVVNQLNHKWKDYFFKKKMLDLTFSYFKFVKNTLALEDISSQNAC